jgi:exportin-1
MGEPSVAGIFYKNFFTLIITDTLSVLTDYRHMSGFKLQCLIIQQLLQVIESNVIIDPITASNGQPHTYPTNKDYVVELLIESIKNLFPNLNTTQIETFVLNLFNHCGDVRMFKSTLRDLLISMKSFSSQDNEFYSEEKKVFIFLIAYWLSYINIFH